MPLIKSQSAPLLIGRAPVLHRTSVNVSGLHGAFRRTRPVGGGTATDMPYPFVKIPHEPEPFHTWPAKVKMTTFLIFFCCVFFIGRPFIMPDDNLFAWAENEFYRRRRERRERQEMEILGIDEHDVDPELVKEVDRLYVKGRNCFV
eukprot:TRINITY_DN7955_c0_g2_i3.p1 TRINITY_DN7955_c0_g2~~TRINITY_DN7955_c0_g2_i3.p1  ORF type:complete len:146 (+),score=9.75 TRINITY_DN7955_c0_g2_i3:62-499(+)